MYLFADISGSATPESNGGDDASVIYHEYTHGLSNRLVLDSSGSPALRAFQSRAMGEGWSDWYAMDYLEGHDLDETDTADNGEMNMAVYVMGGDIHNLRTEGLDCNRGSGADADCPGAGAPAAAATRSATWARSSARPASPSSTPTARSGPRRSGTCASASSPTSAAARSTARASPGSAA